MLWRWYVSVSGSCRSIFKYLYRTAVRIKLLLKGAYMIMNSSSNHLFHLSSCNHDRWPYSYLADYFTAICMRFIQCAWVDLLKFKVFGIDTNRVMQSNNLSKQVYMSLWIGDESKTCDNHSTDSLQSRYFIVCGT